MLDHAQQTLISKYQPIVDSWKGNRIIGYEATTDNFLKIIAHAKTEEINSVDFQARNQALLGIISYLRPKERIFVNLFPNHDLEDRAWFAEDIDLSNVTLEITEHQLFPTSEGVLKKLRSFRNRGIQVALDDFGAGFTGLQLLNIIEPEYVKLDKHFVENMRTDGKTQVIKGMAKFCEETETRLIVEGVQFEEDYERLIDLGIRYMQGFYFGRPMEVAQLR